MVRVASFGIELVCGVDWGRVGLYKSSVGVGLSRDCLCWVGLLEGFGGRMDEGSIFEVGVF